MRSTTLPSGGGSADGRLRLLALDARLDELHQVLAVLVGVLRRIPFGREVLDEHPGHVELGLAHLLARREFQLRRVDQLVRVSQACVSTSASSMTSTAARCCASRMMIFAMPTRPDSFSASRSSAYAWLRSLLRRQVVRRFEIAIVDLVGLDEVQDVDRAILAERGRLQVFLRQHDEAALLVLEALDEILPRDRFTFALADALVAHRRLVSRVQHAELGPVIADGGVQLDGNRDETERNGAFPD